ncbi:class I SAM-dependent methyltransferase [Methanoculleus sp. FWC-SCC3]|uniref:Class I SAM-dependent methyltransferase n=1 Tax=Methanoculleus methanifontis TaxID=2584086 RepID=A0ABT8M2I7_9EURY|nr:class I SAM-dependent methyltransferase [Methanoculleus sp. FWC-SCC3]MDN7013257.1 class I SAM-dependent methyltransferase [Methanoculleus sp. FWC-SCC3]
MCVAQTRQDELLTLLQNPATGNPLAFEGDAMIDTVTSERFAVRNGIPVILRKDDVFGWNRTQQRNYDLFSLVYDLIYTFNVWNVQQWLDEIAGIMEVESGDRVLETSVGTGQQIRNLYEHGVEGRFFGNDITYGQLNKCRKNIGKWGIDVGLVQGNAEALPFNDELFDVVFHIGSINVFNDKRTAIHEMIRVAKPGANLYVADESVKFKEQSTFFGPLMPEPEPGVYDPPIGLIPDGMFDVTTRDLWDGKFWMVSFRKP